MIEVVLAEITTAMGPGEMPDVGPVRAVDASVFRVPKSLQWATYKDGLQAAKILVEYDVGTVLVQAPILTEGSVHEARAVRTLPKQPGTTYLWDRGFWSSPILTTTAATRFTLLLAAQKTPGIKRMDYSVRLVTVRGEDGTPVQLVTNRFDLPAHMVGQMYRHRWQIELFFCWLKHHFRTMRFVGHTRQAVYAQIAAPLS